MSVFEACRRQSILFFTLLALATVGCDEKHPKVEATPPPVVLVAIPEVQKVADYQVFTARTQAVQSVDLKARVTGYLTKIHFKDGAEVKKDEVLFEIDDRPYKAALDQARATLKFNQAALVKAQAEYEIGENVRKSDSGAISLQELAKRKGGRDEAKASIDQAKAVLENATLNYNWCKVRSPLNGRANRHFIDVGNVVTQDVSTLTNIVSLKPTWAYFEVDENTVLVFGGEIKETKVKAPRALGAPVTMTLGKQSDFPFQGKIDFISNQLDPGTGSIRVRAVFPNEDGKLLAGLFGRIKMPLGPQHHALLVNDRAIGTNQGQKFILALSDKNEVEYREIDVGQMHHGLREVKQFRTIPDAEAKGKEVAKKVEVLKASDRVIVDGLQRVRPGMKVEPKIVDMQTLLPKKM
jgi:RND family efflux transporter MFP subunit